jgi:plasmid stabilization system protein ParE
MKEIVWSDRATSRVEEIAAYIAQDSPAAAERWAKDLFDEVGKQIDIHTVRRAQQLIDEDEFGRD